MVKKIIYQNSNYNIKKIENEIEDQIPKFIHTAYFDGMVIMPKCRCYVSIADPYIDAAIHAVDTTGYIALIREHYKSARVKRGCLAKIIDWEYVDDDEKIVKLKIEGVKRFISYEDITPKGYKYEMINPDYRLFQKDNQSTPIPINFDTLDPVFVQFFLQFISGLNFDTNINLDSLSLDKFLNSLIMIMPITEAERFYLSEIPSLSKREETLAMILNCTFNGLTSHYDFH